MECHGLTSQYLAGLYCIYNNIQINQEIKNDQFLVIIRLVWTEMNSYLVVGCEIGSGSSSIFCILAEGEDLCHDPSPLALLSTWTDSGDPTPVSRGTDPLAVLKDLSEAVISPLISSISTLLSGFCKNIGRTGTEYNWYVTGYCPEWLQLA